MTAPAQNPVTRVKLRRLTDKLFGYMYDSISPDPDAVDALQITSSVNPFTMLVQCWNLTITDSVTPANSFTIDLSTVTLAQLVTAINGHAGFSATLLQGGMANLTAMVLFAQTNQPAPNGIAIVQAFTSLAWCFADAWAWQLHLAGAAIRAGLQELRLDLSDGSWVDYWLMMTIGGSRGEGEKDAALIQRIIQTIIAIKSTNLALEDIVQNQLGITVQVVDIPWAQPGRSFHTYGPSRWTSGMLTDTSTFKTPPSFTIDRTVVVSFGLATFPDGRPVWGNPANGHMLQCAFGVVFAQDATTDQRNAVMALIKTIRSAGYKALAMRQVNPIVTDTAGVTDSRDWVVAPASPLVIS